MSDGQKSNVCYGRQLIEGGDNYRVPFMNGSVNANMLAIQTL